MFGLFKKQPSFNSPEQKLEHEMRNKIQNMAILTFGKSPMKGTPFEGTALIASIKDAENFYFIRSIAVSEDYGVSRDKTIEIIRRCARSIQNELIEN